MKQTMVNGSAVAQTLARLSAEESSTKEKTIVTISRNGVLQGV